MIAETTEVPPHVPHDLVRDFRFETLPGADRDAVQAAVDAARQAPDIFFGLGARRNAGAWVVTRHELIREVYQDAETFSSHRNADFSLLVGENWPLLPLEADPPEHAAWRILLNPIFAPAKMKALEEGIEELAVDLIEGLKTRGGCEFVADFAEIFPVRIFLKLFGLPLEDSTKFVEWEGALLHSMTMEGRSKAAGDIVGYLRKVIAERRATPADDLISYVVTAEVNSKPLSDDEAVGVCFLLYSAGLDTVANMLGYIFKHLAEHPDDQQRLRDEPGLIPGAIEEMLRAYPIVVSGRLVTRDMDFHGVHMKKGDLVTLGTMFAGRDAQEFAEPDTVDFDREKVSHISFAAGPHRCVGSHLARRELRIALEEWLRRVPPFRIAPGEHAVTHSIGVFGLSHLPLSW